MDRQQVLHQFMQLYALQPERLSKQVRIEQALRQAIRLARCWKSSC